MSFDPFFLIFCNIDVCTLRRRLYCTYYTLDFSADEPTEGTGLRGGNTLVSPVAKTTSANHLTTAATKKQMRDFLSFPVPVTINTRSLPVVRIISFVAIFG